MARDVQYRALMSPSVSCEEVVNLLGDVDPGIVDRIVATGATADEVGAAIDDLDHERSCGERRVPVTCRAAELRSILDDLESDAPPGARVFPIFG